MIETAPNDEAIAVDSPDTLFRLLAPQRALDEDFFRLHRGSMFIVRRLLGMYPLTCSTIDAFPYALDVISLSAPVLNHSPLCDLGLGPMTPRLRRLIQTVTAMTAECAYCTAHNCGLGDVFRGAAMHSNNGRTDHGFSILPEHLSPAERDAIRLVDAAVKVPARVKPWMRDAAANSFGGLSNLEILARPMALIAYLSVLMETLGAELEPASAAFAQSILTEGRDWIPNSHVLPPPERSTYERNRWSNAAGRDPFAVTANLFGSNSVTSFLDLVYHIFLAQWSSPKSEVPTRGLDGWLQSNLGFYPRYLRDVGDVAARHAYAHTIWNLILQDRTPEDDTRQKVRVTLPSSLKVAAAYAYFCSAQNGLLARHFAFIAFHRKLANPAKLNAAVNRGRSAVPACRVEHDGSEVKYEEPTLIIDAHDGIPTGRTLDTHVFMMAWCEARRDRATLNQLSPQLFYLVDQSAAVCMEVMALLAACAMLQRLSAFMDNGDGLEDELLSVPLFDELPDIVNLKTTVSPDWAETPSELEAVVEESTRMPWGGRISY
ncbi:hypothetical protein HK405_005139 [Cladochytrium tenue]|nr:hypothetical protein HK405_005139 [Cladochytrium tenue]